MNKMNAKKGFVLPLIITVVALLIIGGVNVMMKKEPVVQNGGVNFDFKGDALINTPPSWKSYQASQAKLSISLPTEFEEQKVSDFQIENGIDLQFVPNQKYLLNISGTSTVETSWTVTVGYKGYDCSIKNYSGKGGEGTTTEMVTIDNKNFFVVRGSDCGAGHCGEEVRYVQPLENACRYIQFQQYGPTDSLIREQPGADMIISGDNMVDETIRSWIPQILKTVKLTN